MMDVMDGIFPEEAPASTKYMSKEERRAFEEERRLFYVGMTRARNKLCVFTTDAKSVLTEELFGPGSLRNAEAAKKAATRREASLAKKSGARSGNRKVKRAYEGTSAAVGRGPRRAGGGKPKSRARTGSPEALFRKTGCLRAQAAAGGDGHACHVRRRHGRQPGREAGADPLCGQGQGHEYQDALSKESVAVNFHNWLPFFHRG